MDTTEQLHTQQYQHQYKLIPEQNQHEANPFSNCCTKPKHAKPAHNTEKCPGSCTQRTDCYLTAGTKLHFHPHESKKNGALYNIWPNKMVTHIFS
jgi:hypothetical protein